MSVGLDALILLYEKVFAPPTGVHWTA
ncbi:hypothetical protein SMD11_0478 [Streptomyces albireticuli]|uniref:Uncharacterized protein n=1 Tax=Streptomyces albireticuli TaxID=1940 RepID=A0A1Z2KVR5_9ACTN|nr:hypothetical protein SMD11_0478 [Streptomyces albireticuli]